MVTSGSPINKIIKYAGTVNSEKIDDGALNDGCS
jgi:hypothetical protein